MLVVEKHEASGFQVRRYLDESLTAKSAGQDKKRWLEGGMVWRIRVTANAGVTVSPHSFYVSSTASLIGLGRV